MTMMMMMMTDEDVMVTIRSPNQSRWKMTTSNPYLYRARLLDVIAVRYLTRRSRPPTDTETGGGIATRLDN